MKTDGILVRQCSYLNIFLIVWSGRTAKQNIEFQIGKKKKGDRE